ncbi:malto-oligosyltrehalose synthase [Bailinhaonella thermotolerans]|uniref:Malto-oligosyltrehalose synthase n=1 Tax=Bailinhaonella thermotolerans TaxID=1070861 RepID=A0A3A4AWN9_9ACTN|nr:malto-oligosyltrehalose synthase [Bailinhaonella thermotolerans]
MAALGGYLAALGVTHVYLSPVLQAVPASRHGYDVVDHGRIRAEFGGEEAFRDMARRLRALGIGVVVDIVPNHMAVPVPESLNPALWSVLKDGRTSPYAPWFDIDWDEEGRFTLPVLGDPADEPEPDGDLLRYHDHVFPRPGHYRLADWREGPGYRRFFDVSGLIGLRVEDPSVFAATHEVIFNALSEGLVDGLRVDHPDGLADPRGYLRGLRERAPVWTVVEKILVGGERLPADWPCDGTTGYDVLNMITRIFVDPEGEAPLLDLFVRRTGAAPDYEQVALESKREVIDLFFRREIERLGLDPRAAAELLAAMPVYRAYVVPGEPVPPEAEEIVRRAADRAGTPELADAVLRGDPETVVRFQQTCGPVMAKGVEDTALYRWYPLACLNEVGGEPNLFAVSPADFHAFCARLADAWPHTMTTLSTHDTKRSEDVRARLAVLAELPEEWGGAVGEWSDKLSFDPALDYLAWQNLAAAWPIGRERLTDYLLKAAREAKTAISWIRPDPDYEEGLRDFAARAVLLPVGEFTARIDPYARVNSLGQKLVQLMIPGVPDVYQGTETTDFSLVDPDNRRPVDFVRRRVLLDGLAAPSPGVPPSWDAAKLLVTSRALRVRRELAPAAPYTPLRAEGEAAGHALAFSRGTACAVVTRFPVRLERRGGWGDTRLPLPGGRWRDVLTGREHEGAPLLRDLLSALPVALLVRAGGGPR